MKMAHTNWTAEQIKTGHYRINPDATDEQLQQFANDMNATQQEFNVECNPSRLWGMTRDEMFADTATWAKQYKRRAGVRALKAKYGHDISDRIVTKHSGRHIR